MRRRPLRSRLAALAALDDPVRLALLEFVGHSELPVTRDSAAHALGLSRTTAGSHLDRLAAEGLVTVHQRRLGTRRGPGAGRPSKVYERALGDVTVSVPDRRYDLASEVLAAAVEEADRSGEAVTTTVKRVARRVGGELARGAESLPEALQTAGFEPRPDVDGALTLSNCPFHDLAQQHPRLVCGLNVELVAGMAQTCGRQPETVVFDPAPGRCCVRIRSTA